MFESEDEIRQLQALFDRTFARANPHLANIVQPERRLAARQVVRYLQGTKHVAFATVNERGEPRVAPLDGVFIRAGRARGERQTCRSASGGDGEPRKSPPIPSHTGDTKTGPSRRRSRVRVDGSERT